MTRLLLFTFLSVPLVGAFVMFALGIVVIYRASRVLNLAHGAMAMLPAYVYYSLTRAHLPLIAALPLAVAAGAALGVGVEWIFVRRLRAQGSTAQTVGTIAVTGLLIALVAKLYGSGSVEAPGVFPRGALSVAHASVRYGELGLLVVGLAAAGGLFAFFRFTELGLAMRGAAQNRTAAVLMGVNPDRAASLAWAMGGGLAALAGVLLAAVTNLDPYTLSLQVLPAFVAVLLGGLESLPGAVAGAVVVGLMFGLVPALSTAPLIGGLLRLAGAPQLLLTVLALVVLAASGRRLAGSDTEETALVSTSARHRSAAPGAAGRRAIGLLAAGLGLLAWSWVVPYSVLGSSLLALDYAVVAVSLVVLIGWVGQISLAQATFVGIGALFTASAARSWGLGFPASLAVGAVVGALAASVLGAVALRVRGLYLAVATLIFAWMGDAFLFPSPWLGLGGGSSTIPAQRIGAPGGFPSFDFTSRRTLFLTGVVVVALLLAMMANLRDTRVGRAFFAVRGSEMAAASVGIDVTRYKLLAFALSGSLAGLGGTLIMVQQRTVVPDQFQFTVSLQYLAIAVVGGLGSLAGAVAAGVLFAALNEVFFRVAALAGWLDVVSAALLAAVLLAYPGGLAALGTRGRALATQLAKVLAGWVPAALDRAHLRVNTWLPAGARADARFTVWLQAVLAAPRGSRTRSGSVPADGADWLAGLAAPLVDVGLDNPTADLAPAPIVALPAAAVRGEFADRAERSEILGVTGVTVRFGGLTAVADVSLSVRDGEVVGLIGPNGAGKTTLFNAVLGLNKPATGSIHLAGADISHLGPHRRAQAGIARTFQVLQLFGELTVAENLLVATHRHNESGLISNLVAGPATVAAERMVRRRVRTVLRLLELDHLADAPVRGLPFGVLRMVELGRSLVTGARLLLLDEPASGLNDAETDRLMDVLRQLGGLGVTVLLIEHDMRMVTSVSDYVYVLDLGKMLAHGEPAAVQQDQRVKDAYLGAAPLAPAPDAAPHALAPVGQGVAVEAVS